MTFISGWASNKARARVDYIEFDVALLQERIEALLREGRYRSATRYVLLKKLKVVRWPIISEVGVAECIKRNLIAGWGRLILASTISAILRGSTILWGTTILWSSTVLWGGTILRSSTILCIAGRGYAILSPGQPRQD